MDEESWYLGQVGKERRSEKEGACLVYIPRETRAGCRGSIMNVYPRLPFECWDTHIMNLIVRSNKFELKLRPIRGRLREV